LQDGEMEDFDMLPETGGLPVEGMAPVEESAPEGVEMQPIPLDPLRSPAEEVGMEGPPAAVSHAIEDL
ncbi:MAG: hypothetical protein HQL31_04275, partial [Planctomycetes bacterium]|nr:hypothetical protein [Planctomycetota bacterium]